MQWLRKLVLASLVTALLPGSAAGRHTKGQITLSPGRASVVAKFCFDFNPACADPGCSGAHPGWLTLTVRAVPVGSYASGAPHLPMADLHVALLDDEYFSFPEVSPVWDDVPCGDVLRAAKKSYSVPNAQQEQGEQLQIPVVQKVRPRWWYLALVSCHSADQRGDGGAWGGVPGMAAAPAVLGRPAVGGSTSGLPAVAVSFDAHFQNTLQGAQAELSMDEPGNLCTLVLCTCFGVLATSQLSSLGRWKSGESSVFNGGCLAVGLFAGGIGGTGGRRLPDALVLVTASVVLAAIGSGCWLARHVSCCAGAEAAAWRWEVMSLGFTSVAKAVTSLLLLLIAQGECVCTPDIAWAAHRELEFGLGAFACLGFFLELWGDSELRNTTTEYVYDTRPGTALVGIDIIWLWLYVTRVWRTFQAETRPRPRRFYKRYGSFFALWFAALPVVAILAGMLAPWVRRRVAFLVAGLAHAIVLSILVVSLGDPIAAGETYDLRPSELMPVAPPCQKSRW